MKPSEKSKFGKYFFITTIVIYILTSFYNPEITLTSLIYFKGLLIKIIPVILLIFILLVISDLYLTEEKTKKLNKNLSGAKGWILSIISGIISSGPIYMWYPFLSNLQKKGVRPAYLVAFLYNRAIKLPQLPIMFAVFDIYLISILFIVMIISSIIQGIITEKILEKWG